MPFDDLPTCIWCGVLTAPYNECEVCFEERRIEATQQSDGPAETNEGDGAEA